MSLIHYEYLLIVAVAWIWGISQVVHAVTGEWVRPWPPSKRAQGMFWRISAAIWMLVKAVFLTYVGYHTWEDMPGHEEIVGLFAIVHLAVFIQWALLPSDTRPVAEPPVIVRKEST